MHPPHPRRYPSSIPRHRTRPSSASQAGQPERNPPPQGDCPSLRGRTPYGRAAEHCGTHPTPPRWMDDAGLNAPSHPSNLENPSLVGPGTPIRNPSPTAWIVPHIDPFFVRFLPRSQPMMEAHRLPASRLRTASAEDELPIGNPPLNFDGFGSRSAKQVKMVRHQKVIPNLPGRGF
jgi:hypothetical protein